MNKCCIGPLILWVSGCGYRGLFWSVGVWWWRDRFKTWVISCQKADFFSIRNKVMYDVKKSESKKDNTPEVK